MHLWICLNAVKDTDINYMFILYSQINWVWWMKIPAVFCLILKHGCVLQSSLRHPAVLVKNMFDQLHSAWRGLWSAFLARPVECLFSWTETWWNISKRRRGTLRREAPCLHNHPFIKQPFLQYIIITLEMFWRTSEIFLNLNSDINRCFLCSRSTSSEWSETTCCPQVVQLQSVSSSHIKYTSKLMWKRIFNASHIKPQFMRSFY